MIGYVVESDVYHGVTGERAGTARIYVASPERARELAGQKPGATWRAIEYADMPLVARQNLEQMEPAR